MKKNYLLHKKNMIIAFSILLFFVVLTIVSKKVNEYSKKQNDITVKEVAESSSSSKNKVTITSFKTITCNKYNISQGSVTYIDGATYYGVTPFTATCSSVTDGGAIPSEYTKSKDAYCLDGADAPAGSTYVTNSVTYGGIEKNIAYIANHGGDKIDAAAALRYLGYTVGGFGKTCANYENHKNVCYFFNKLNWFLDGAQHYYCLDNNDMPTTDSSKCKEGSGSYVTLRNSSNINSIIKGESASNVVQEQQISKNLNLTIGTKFDYDNKGCSGGVCHGQFTLKGVLKGNAAYNVTADKPESTVDSLKVEASASGNDIIITVSFNEADCKKLNVSNAIKLPLKIEGLITYTVLIPEGGTTNMQRLLIIDKNPKVVNIGLQIDACSNNDCDSFISTNKVSSKIGSYNTPTTTDEQFKELKQFFEQESENKFTIDPNRKGSEEEPIDCCTTSEKLKQYKNVYEGMCTNGCELYLSKTKVKEALVSAEKGDLKAKKDFKKSLEDQSKKYTFARPDEETKYENCCDTIKGKYDKLYKALCEEPTCEVVLKDKEFDGKLKGNVTQDIFDKTKELVEKVSEENYEKKYTLGEKEGYEDCCEDIIAINPKYRSYCQKSCLLAIEDKREVFEKITDDSTFEAAQGALAEWSKERNLKTTYTLFKFGAAPDTNGKYEDCCEVAYTDAGLSNAAKIKSLCEGSCKLLLKDKDIGEKAKNVQSKEEFIELSNLVNSKTSGKFALDGSGSKSDCCKTFISDTKNKKIEEYCKPKTCDDIVDEIKKDGTSIKSAVTTKIKEPLYLSKEKPNDKNNCCKALQQIANSDDDKKFLKDKCGDDSSDDKKTSCENIGFKLFCDPINGFGSPTEIYQVYEGLDGYTRKDKISECVVNVEGEKPGDRRKFETYFTNAINSNFNEENMKDAMNKVDGAPSKNHYTLKESENNRYCRINCYERWDYQFATFENFTGVDHAIKAGSYFAMDKDLYIKGARTCVTTFIDYQAYYLAVRQLSNRMIVAWNTLVEYTDAFNDAVEHAGYHYNAEEEKKNPIYNDDNNNICPASHGEGDTWEDENGNTWQEYKCSTELKRCPVYGVHIQNSNSSRQRPLEHEDFLYKLLEEVKAENPKKYGSEVRPSSKEKKKLSLVPTVATKRYAADTGPQCISGPDCTGTIDTVWRCDYAEMFKEDSKAFKAIMAGYYYNGENSHKESVELTYNSLNTTYLSSEGYETPNNFDRGEPYKIDEGGNIPKTINQAKADLNEFLNALRSITSDMAYCQNFFLSNDEEEKRVVVDTSVDNYNYGKTENMAPNAVKAYKDADNYIYNGKKTFDDSKNASSVSSRKVSSTYNPAGEYKYDEYDYMTQIGEYNQLIDNIKRNEQVYGPVKTFNSKNKLTNNQGDLDIYYNKIDTLAYNMGDDNSGGGVYYWENDTDNGHKYSDSGKKVATCGEGQSGSECVGFQNGSEIKINDFMTVCSAGDYPKNNLNYELKKIDFQPNENKNLDCDEHITFRYYPANYISQTLTNSSYFVNFGNFYFRGAYEDVQFAKDMDTAMSKSRVKQTDNEKYQWSVLASQNVFPISSLTRRGIYSYYYKFSNMGNYNDHQELGRVIGHGEEGRSIVYQDGAISDGEHWCQYEVYESLCACCGYPIGTLISVHHGDQEVTVKEKETFKTQNAETQIREKNNTSGGEMLYYPSTVSLYELSSVGNWGNSTNILYEGQNYVTSNDKGGQLSDAIKKIGENIYDVKPEYSFNLTPTELQNIINDNHAHGSSYIVNYDNLTVEGTPRYIAGNENPEESPRFVHYSSNFIKNGMAGENNGLFGESGRGYDSNCYVNSYNENDIKNFANGSSYTQCKWLDFCGTAGAAKQDTVPGSINYCLAFK